MNAHVHYRLTRRWALEAGFTDDEAEAIASADVAVDSRAGGDLFHPWHWHYHYRMAAAGTLASYNLHRAARHRDLELLGTALHQAQDSITHGWLGLLNHVLHPLLDVWERRPPEVREAIEERSREMLAAYRRDVADAADRAHTDG